MDEITFAQQFEKFAALSKLDGRFEPRWEDCCRCLHDDTPQTEYESPPGLWAAHYILHTGWAARKLAAEWPRSHHDFGSSLYFISMVSAFVSVNFYDLRPSRLPFQDLKQLRADLTHIELPSGECESVSCMHVLEHVGLGRYGDRLDASGDQKAAIELARILKPGGRLLIVMPMEETPRLTFNSDRLYSHKLVLGLFPSLTLREFSLITQDGKFFEDCNPSALMGQSYACGCFDFVK